MPRSPPEQRRGVGRGGVVNAALVWVVRQIGEKIFKFLLAVIADYCYPSVKEVICDDFNSRLEGIKMTAAVQKATVNIARECLVLFQDAR